jgi:Mg-chelatase subunit ChlD
VSLSFTEPVALALLLVLIPLVRAWLTHPNALTPQRKRVALALRCSTLTCLVLALAGAQMVTLTDNVTVVFLMDRSLSTGGDSQGWQRRFAGDALAHRDRKDQFGIVLFGKDSRVELACAPHDRRAVEPFTAVVDRSASSMTSALRFAATTFPGNTASRLVVLSDGQTTESETGEEAAALAAAGIEVWTVPLPDSQVKDLLISRLEAPNQIAVDEPFVLRTVIESAGISEAELLLSANGQPRERLRLKLRDGPNLFLIPQRVTDVGPVRYEARVLAAGDERQENNKGEALLVAGQKQSVWVLRASSGPGTLVPMLRRAGIQARAVTVAELPRRVGAWRDVSALVIEDVSAIDWSLDLQKVVSLLVREGGMGLLMLGSDATFGVGGYQHTAIEPLLPVNLAVRRPKDMPLAALVQCLDKSGSMSGRPIEMAREAAIAAGGTLSERDLLGVVGFDEAATWVYDFQEKGDGTEFQKGVGSLRAGGGTDLFPALREALDELEGAEAALKHIIVLSDGAVAPADFDSLMREAAAHHVTVSAVALGSGADLTFLTELTRKGKGRLYVAPEANAGSPLPQIFIRETLLATGSGINDKPTEVRPSSQAAGSPLLQGLLFQGTPPLLAYNMTSSRGGTASTLLQSPKKDPILAVGRAGLGKTAAWTSDLGGAWAASWTATPGARGASLLETLLLRTVRSVNAVGDLSQRSRGNQLEARAQSLGDLSTIALRLTSREPLKGPVKAVVVNSRGESVEAVLHPETPFLATGSVQVTEPGSSVIFAQDPDGQLLARCNLSVPLTPEFAKLGTDRELLKELAQRSSGRFDASPADVFRAPLHPFPVRTPLGFDLIRGAILLLLLEIAVRRLPVPRGVGRRQRSAQVDTAAAALRQQMSQLRQARKASREPPARSLSKPRVQRAGEGVPPRSGPPAAGASKPLESAAPEVDASQSTLSRLREAKKRSREDR